MSGTHQRNVGPMQASPRCQARTRSGALCQAPKIAGAARCRMHGGRGSGAPRGNKNALKDGFHTAPRRQRRAEAHKQIEEARAFNAMIEELFLKSSKREPDSLPRRSAQARQTMRARGVRCGSIRRYPR